MARYWQSTATTPISQFVELPLEFMQGQLDKRQLKRDALNTQMSATLNLTPIELSKADNALSVAAQKQFYNNMEEASTNMIGDDLDAAKNSLRTAQKSLGLTVDDTGAVTYDQTSLPGMIQANRVRFDEYYKNLADMKTSGKIGDATEYYNLNKSLLDYDLKGGAYSGAWSATTPSEDIDWEEYGDSFADSWNKDGAEWFVNNVDGFGEYVGTQGYTKIDETAVASFYDDLMENHPQFKNQMYAEWVYSLPTEEERQYAMMNESAIKNDTSDTNPFEVYKDSRKESYKSMFANKIGMLDTDMTYSRSTQGEINVAAGSEEAIKLLDAENVTAVVTPGGNITPTSITDLQKSITAFDNLSTNANADLTAKQDDLKNYMYDSLGLTFDLPFGMNKITQAVVDDTLLKNVVTIDDNGFVKVADTAYAYLKATGKTDKEISDITNNVVAKVEEVNTAATNKNAYDFSKRIADMQLEDINNQFEKNGYFDWTNTYTSDLNSTKEDALFGISLDDIYDSNTYKQAIIAGDTSAIDTIISNLETQIDNTDYQTNAPLLSDLYEKKRYYESIKSTMESSIDKYNNSMQTFIESGEYKSSNSWIVDGGTDKAGIGKISVRFDGTTGETVTGLDSWVNVYGTQSSQELKDNGFDLTQPITKTSQYGIFNNRSVIYTTVKGVNEKGETIVYDMLPIDILKSNQESFVIDTKNSLSQQYVISSGTNQYGAQADPEESALIERSYVTLNCPELYPSADNLPVGDTIPIKIQLNNGEGTVTLKHTSDNKYQIVDNEGNVAYIKESVFSDNYVPIEGDINKVGELIGRYGLMKDTDFSKLGTYGTTIGVTSLKYSEEEQ